MKTPGANSDVLISMYFDIFAFFLIILLAFIKYISFNLVMALYVCDQCGKSFTLGTNLSRHKQVHVNGKFSCNNCFLKFSSQLSLDQHRRNVHGVHDEKPSGFCCRQAIAWLKCEPCVSLDTALSGNNNISVGKI